MDLEKVKTLIDFVGQSKISELVVRQGDTTIRITRGSQPAPDTTEQTNSNTTEIATTGNDTRLSVCAPVFGLVHQSPNPGSAPFVKIGDLVETGQSLCIIEAMKVFNSVLAERAGRVVRILVDDGQEVEAGQPIMEIA